MNWTILVPLVLLYVVQTESRFFPKQDFSSLTTKAPASAPTEKPAIPICWNDAEYKPECQDVTLPPKKSSKHSESVKTFTDDEKPLPVPASIPERLQKYCKSDPESKFCKDLGLGKKKRRFEDEDDWAVERPENEYTEDDWAVTRKPIFGEEDGYEEDDWAVTRRPEEEDPIDYDSTRDEEERIDCLETPEHPGCLRNRYLDQFIAWKIGKDCEVNPNGPFCPKTLARGCEGNSEPEAPVPAPTTTEAPTTTTTEAPKPSKERQKEAYIKILHKILDEIRKNPTSEEAQKLYKYLDKVMEKLRQLENSSDSGSESEVTTSAPVTGNPAENFFRTFLKTIYELSQKMKNRNSTHSETTKMLGELMNYLSNIPPSQSAESVTMLKELLHFLFQIPSSTSYESAQLQILRFTIAQARKSTVGNRSEILNLYRGIIDKYLKMKKAQNPAKNAPSWDQEVYIGQESASKPIASYSGTIPQQPKSYFSFY